MSVNAYEPHLIIIPEDDATRQLAVGFTLITDFPRKIDIRQPEGGWTKVVQRCLEDYCPSMNSFPERRILLLVDFDGNPSARRDLLKSQLPEGLQERVYVIGVSSEAEDLKRRCNHKSFEVIGEDLARECSSQTHNLWKDELLSNNQAEIERFDRDVRPFLFR